VLKYESTLSTHGLSIGLQLELGQSLGMLPPVVRLVGATIDRAELGGAISTTLQESVPDAVRIIKRLAMLCANKFGGDKR